MQHNIFAKHIRSKRDNSILFCMPGHNGADIGIDTSMDITELSFSDNLQYPTTVIKDIENRIALSYKIPYAMIYTAGATSAILSALVVAKHYGNTIVVGENTHKSVFSLSRILGFKILQTSAYCIRDIEKVLSLDDKISSVVFTSPNYFGKTFSIEAPKQLSKHFDALLICDQSHGGHFAFSKLLPSPNDKIADITISSWHKTLPVLTGGAIATCNDIAIYNQLLLARADTHTTSPSYMTMVSIDSANSRFSEDGEQLYADIHSFLEKFKHSLNHNYTIENSDDFTRLVINTNSILGDYVAKLLEQDNIFIEMTYCNLLVFIVTPYNYKHLPKLSTSLNRIADNHATMALVNNSTRDNSNNNNIVCCDDKNNLTPEDNRAEMRLENYESDENISDNTRYLKHDSTTYNDNTTDRYKEDFSATICLDLWQSVGFMSAKYVSVYPPGVPVLTDGKVITAEDIRLLISNIGNILGLIDGKIICYRRK